MRNAKQMFVHLLWDRDYWLQEIAGPQTSIAHLVSLAEDMFEYLPPERQDALFKEIQIFVQEMKKDKV